MSRDLDRARGALWGQAVGDAVGTTQEFARCPDAKPFPELNLGPQTDMVGGGPFGLDPGQVTDDTQMAICIADSLADQGRYDARDVARRYVAWSRVAFDIGNQTLAALSCVERLPHPTDAGFHVWETSKRGAAANGSLMRCSPIPVFFAERPHEARLAALEDSAITHADPRCRLAVAAFTAAIVHALTDADATPESMRRAALAELDLAAPLIDRTPEHLVHDAVHLLREDLELATRPDPLLLGSEVDLHRHAGYVRVAFRLAFWELLHAPSFAAAVLDGANRGGDADTNAAISGALYGALAGERRIPEPWRARVEGSCRRKGMEGNPFAEVYHPSHLFRVAS